MGDHADDALDNLCDTDEIYCQYQDVPEEDLPEEVRELMYDNNGGWMPGPFAGVGRRRAIAVRQKRCKFCGASGLVWGVVAGGSWRLVDGHGVVHECPEYRSTASEVE